MPMAHERRIGLSNTMAGMHNSGRIPMNNGRQSMQMGCNPCNYQESAMHGMQSSNTCFNQDASMQEMHRDRCECISQETSIDCVNLAQAYVPFQKFCHIWQPLKSLIAGTIFPELFSPYKKREYVNLEPEVTCGMRPARGGCY